MALFIVQLLTGLANAMFLFLVASGLSLIFGVTRIVNFAHGSFYMLAAYLASSLAAALPLGPASFYAAVVLAPLGVALLGGLIEVCLLRRIYRAPELYQVLLTFAVVLVIGDAVKFFWGTENRTGPSPPGLSGSVPILGQLFPTYDLAILLLGPLLALGLWWVLHRTRWGILIRAATSDREMVGALGVNQAWLFTGVFVLGTWLAGLAGALQMPRVALTTVMDSTVIVETFVVVVIGGMGSAFGALLGAVLIGVLQAFGILWLPREFQLAIIFILMAAVLILRPWGLLGRPETESGTAGEALRREVGGRLRPPRWVWAGILLALMVLPSLLPTFYVWVLVEILAFALFAGSLQLLVGTGGMLSFGHAAYFGLGAYGAALLMKQAALPMPVAFLLAPLVAAAAALFFGAFCVRLSGVYFAMLTLAFAQIAFAVVHQWYDFTGGDNGILGVWPAASLAAPVRYYYLALLAAVCGLSALWRVTGSPFGYTLRAARDHPRRCQAVGVNVRSHRLLAFGVAGFFAGLGGAVFAFAKGSVFPDYLSMPMSVQSLVMVLLGGIHALAGAPVGAAVYKLLDIVITKYTGYWQAVLGGILVFLVVAFPHGLVGFVQARWARMRASLG
ncbi:MAG: ABC transporter permease [candidate division NC10 bacterium RIFCSPLOWO2_12_FULL_66_18]|nr:MAG: ABC transporter permease [candidate division NC10 bacterium RIFCSPLOWO2_12_FULL_66_18]